MRVRKRSTYIEKIVNELDLIGHGKCPLREVAQEPVHGPNSIVKRDWVA